MKNPATIKQPTFKSAPNQSKLVRLIAKTAVILVLCCFYIPAQAQITLNLSAPASINCGDDVTVQVTADGISDIVNLSFSVNWNPSEFEYTSNSSMALGGTGLSIGDSGPLTGMGQLTYSWFDDDIVSPGKSLANGSVILEITFTAVSDGEISIELSDTPTPREASDNAFNSIDVSYGPAALVIASPLNPLTCPDDLTKNTDPGACFWTSEAGDLTPIIDFSSPCFSVRGCTDPAADNYDPNATEDDGSCQYTYEPCLSAVYGQWPPATFTPACPGGQQTITACGFGSEYSRVNVVSGNTYNFASSVGTDYITISDENGTTGFRAGTSPLVWTANLTGVVRFYTHLDESCPITGGGCRTKSVSCMIPEMPFRDFDQMESLTWEINGNIGTGDASGTTFPVGTSTVTYTASDMNGNSGTCSFTVTVEDISLPSISCIDQTIEFNGEESIELDPDSLVEADDNCGLQSIGLSPTIITPDQIGQTLPVLVTVTDVNGNTSTCNSQITLSGLPAGWSQNANGVGCEDGNAIDYSSDNATWTATSTNCFYSSPFTSDASAFAQYSLCGNGSITAQVTGITGTSLGWAGVVMRETNAPGAKKAQLTTNMSNFSRREFRTTTNGTAFPQQFPSQNRRWLRIVRSGNQFAMYVSHNGFSWAFAGVQNIQMNSCIEIGLVVTNYSSNSTVTATFANVSVTGNNALSMDYNGVLAAIENKDDLRGFNVFPNPTSGELNIALRGYDGRPVTLEVFNTMGQMLYTKKVDEVQNADEIIDLSSVASGMYLIRVSSDGLPAEMKRVTVAR